MSQQILDEYISRPQLAEQLGKSEHTLARWHREHIGPPVTFIGRDPYYKIQGVQKWLRTREQSLPSDAVEGPEHQKYERSACSRAVKHMDEGK